MAKHPNTGLTNRCTPTAYVRSSLRQRVNSALDLRRHRMRCELCARWEHDFGIWTVTGWTGADKLDGYCYLMPKKVRKDGTECCSLFLPKEEQRC